MTGLDGGGIRVRNGGWWGVCDASAETRHGGLSLEEYAAAVAARELILDDTGIRVHGGVITGDIERAWARLGDHAARHRVPVAPGDLERTNRVAAWDRLIVDDPETQESWRRVYPTALAHTCGLPVAEDAGRSAVMHLEKQPSLLWNAFVALVLRRPSVTGELRAHVLRSPSVAPPPRAEDVTVFPGDSLPNLSDFARIQVALETGNFMGTLYKEGLDPIQFARISDRWASRLAADPSLRAEYAVMLRRHAEVSTTKYTEPLPAADTLVFPGQKLARVSDFARISRAAKRDEFKAALARAGVDPDTFANLCARFNARMKTDKIVEAQFQRLLDDPRID